MNSKELVKMLMEQQGLSQSEMAEKMGFKSQQVLWDRLNSSKTKSMSVSKLSELLVQLGYEIVIMPRAKAGKIDNAYVIKE